MRKLIFILFLFVCKFSFAITPVFTCGFECGVFSSVGSHLNQGSGTATISTTTVRSGARSLRVNPSAGQVSAIIASISSSAIVVWRIYVRYASLPTSDASIVFCHNGTSYPGAYFKSSDSKIYAGIDGAFGATGVAITTNTWYRIDVRVNETNNPWLIDVSVDGVACGQYSNAAAASTETVIRAGTAGSNNETFDAFYDDLIVSTTTGDYPIGGGYVNHFVPTSDGTHSGITANDFQRTLTATDILNSATDSYQLIDDVPLESGSSVDWMNMSAPVLSTYLENIFGPASGISTPTVAPRFASVIIGIHAAGTGAYNAEWLLNDNGTTSAIFTASAVAGVTTVIYKTLNLADPPSAASAWTLTGNGNFNNIRVRFGPTASVDANPDVYFDCAMIEAEFEEIALTVPGTPSDKRHTTLGVGIIPKR